MAQESLRQIIMVFLYELEAQARCMALTLKRPPEILLLALCTLGLKGPGSGLFLGFYKTNVTLAPFTPRKLLQPSQAAIASGT